MIGEEDLKRLVKEKHGGKYESALGPCVVGQDTIYEVWTVVGGAYHNRYVVEHPDGKAGYFERFEKLAVYLNSQHIPNAGHDISGRSTPTSLRLPLSRRLQ
jgi:hypothetical protein